MMNDKNNGIQNTIVQVIVRGSCKICDRILEQIKPIPQKFKHVEIQVFNLENENTIPDHCQSFITPAIWVNGVLWYLGGFDYDRFCEKLILLDNPGYKMDPANIRIN